MPTGNNVEAISKRRTFFSFQYHFDVIFIWCLFRQADVELGRYLSLIRDYWDWPASKGQIWNWGGTHPSEKWLVENSSMTWIRLISTWNPRDSVLKTDEFSSSTSIPRGFDKPFLTGIMRCPPLRRLYCHPRGQDKLHLELLEHYANIVSAWASCILTMRVRR